MLKKLLVNCDICSDCYSGKVVDGDYEQRCQECIDLERDVKEAYEKEIGSKVAFNILRQIREGGDW